MAGTTESTACSKKSVKSKRQPLKGPNTLSDSGVHVDGMSIAIWNCGEFANINCNGDGITSKVKNLTQMKTDIEEQIVCYLQDGSRGTRELKK